MRELVCPICDEEFSTNHGRKVYCSRVCKIKSDNNRQRISGQFLTEYQYSTINGKWPRYLGRLARHSKQRRDDGLTKEILLSILKDQDYKCALSGISLTCIASTSVKSPFNASVDRIIPGGPYTKENIQLVCKSLNCFRLDLPVEEFVEMCGLVYKYNSKAYCVE